VLVPPDPGNVSAFGLLTVDVKNDYVQTMVTLHGAIDVDRLARGFDSLTAQAAAALVTEGFAAQQHRFVRTADLRYFGQAFEVRVPVPEGALDPAAVDAVADAFHAEHRSLYGYDFSGDGAQQVEWVNLRVSGIGPIRRPTIRRHPEPATDAPTPRSQRPVCFDAGAGYVDTPVFWRTDLLPVQGVSGPVVIEEYGSTVLVDPDSSPGRRHRGAVLLDDDRTTDPLHGQQIRTPEDRGVDVPGAGVEAHRALAAWRRRVGGRLRVAADRGAPDRADAGDPQVDPLDLLCPVAGEVVAVQRPVLGVEGVGDPRPPLQDPARPPGLVRAPRRPGRSSAGPPCARTGAAAQRSPR
jgi:hypothetical protein